MSKPLISIVVCCHNRRDYLSKTMDSIFAQKYAPVEIVVLDDGSTDGTGELMASYGDKVRYHWQQQRGVAVARTAACQLARGEYIAFQDDDDLMAPERITHLYEALCKYPSAIFATAGYEVIDKNGALTGVINMPNLGCDEHIMFIEDAYTACLWPKVPVNPHTTLFRKSDGEKIGWFDHDFKYASSDKDFYIRLAKLGPMVYLKEIVSYYRRGHSSIWSNNFRALYGRIQLLEKHLRLMDSNKQDLRNRLKQRLLRHLKQIAKYKSTGQKIDDPYFENFIRQGLLQLGARERFLYMLYTNVKLPIRNIIKK